MLHSLATMWSMHATPACQSLARRAGQPHRPGCRTRVPHVQSLWLEGM